MKAMILCGGRGTRLREYTELKPKPMVEIGGRPILWHIMKLYAHHGINEFILCLGYKGDVIKEYFLNYEAMNADFTVELGQSSTIHYHDRAHGEDGWKVTLADTGEHTMTGARILRAAKYLGPNPGTFCMTYGDGLSNVDLTKAAEFHRSHGKLATLTGVRPPSRFGELDLVGSQVTNFSEKPNISEGIINGGFMFLEPGFLKYLSMEPNCVLEQTGLEHSAKDGQLHVYEHMDFWQCMDTYREWEMLEKQWQQNRAPWKVWK